VSSVQRLLSAYLQCELYHSLGAYGVAEERLEAIAGELGKVPEDQHPKGLLTVVGYARGYNQLLREQCHASLPVKRTAVGGEASSGSRSWPARHPLPTSLPLTKPKRFEVDPEDDDIQHHRHAPWKDAGDWERVPKFYSEAIEALRMLEGEHKNSGNDHTEQFRKTLADSLVTPRDGGTSWDLDGVDRRRRRLHRYQNRREEAHLVLSQDAPSQGRIQRWFGGDGELEQSSLDLDEKYQPNSTFLEQIATGHLAMGDESLAMFVVNAQAEAHLSMHAVEAWKTMCLGEHSASLGKAERDWLDEELNRSIALSTFAYCVSRTAPWLFAKDDAERRLVSENIAKAWENVVPPRCMWIANQLSLLALHRRAYARSLRDDAEKSYNDYHKLQQLIRDTDRRVREAPIHAEGTLEFLTGLNAEAHHHIGELYRAEHAQKPALTHFEAADHRLNQLKGNDLASDVLVDSRWYIQLHISLGKACYEMGRHKEALFWYLRAWCRFLELFATASQTETSTDELEVAIKWLDSVRFEPELRKSEISKRLRPVIDQLDRITAVGPLGALAAEILLRLGHLLFVLNVGLHDLDAAPARSAATRDRDAKERVRGTLAFACLAKAAECDPYSTLAGADLLKTTFRLEEELPPELLGEPIRPLERPELKPISQHWPRGGDDYEQLTRVAEYMLLQQAHAGRNHNGTQSGDPDDRQADAQVARKLLLNLFMSTDSINVRKAQIHRFLMKAPADASIPEDSALAIEFVCMRRYSSPFPLLPRPSAFRALGGGYFLRLHRTADDPRKDDGPFGVVVDPGVDFVENLYRTGYSLSDIDMIVLTHDHVDHLGALDPLLSLLHVRSELLSEQAKHSESDSNGQREEPPPKTVKVLMSRSVEWRYDSVDQLKRSSEIEFKCFADLFEDSDRAVGKLDDSDPFLDGFPKSFEIVAMSSAAGQGDGGGHLDLSLQPSHGLCFRLADGKGPSLAITSDTPMPPSSESKEKYAEWREVWGPALEADVLVAHLGSVPLTELRRMSQADGEAVPPAGSQPQPLKDEEEILGDFKRNLEAANEHLRGQIEYAQWLRSRMPEGSGKSAESLTAPLVGEVPEEWLPPSDHNYLAGLLAWARNYLLAHGSGHGGLFVVGELSEELASMRGKIASRLNELLFDVPGRRENGDSNRFPCVLTADIGLHVCITPDADESEGGDSPVKVLCTTCNLDTDRAPGERFHRANAIYEVCVKGENEGIFYNCLEHDPHNQDDPTFLEQLERFDIFGR
jgi:tetratricopeptide (TPR) repeat protein